MVYNRIKAVLADKNKKSNDLVRLLNKSTTTVSKWCNNKAQPHIKDLFVIAKYLEVEPSELLISLDEYKKQ